ncbi:MAG TPA: adenylyltransferase/cytidyltransferase family protein [Thermoplasmata archaeon]|nr:adenylyltransferase/cytidyltransferase family protein [Thermoplasmata archaeon]
MATGVFDILHSGHLAFLREAKKLGDELVVVVATDALAEKMKHRPINSQETRLELINEIRMVDRALIGDDRDMYKTVERVRPDVIALGFDQKHDETKILAEIERRGLGPVRIVRVGQFGGELEATRRIVQKIIEWYRLQQELAKVEGKKQEEQELDKVEGKKQEGEE